MTTIRRGVEALASVAPQQRLDVLSLPEPPAWMGQALCAQTGDVGFFPEGRGRTATDAKAVCSRCPVREKCLAYALELESQGHNRSYGPFGVWGGLSAHERRMLLRERREAS